MFPIILVTIFLLIMIGAVIAWPAIKLKNELYKKTGKHPEGHYVGLGMGLGLALGMPLGIAMDNIALGPGFGLPIGLAIGTALEKKYRHKLRKLTKEEIRYQKRAILFAIVSLVLGVFAALTIILLR
ncbi:hypothetical protein JW930_02090 [Candidatus Woesearchaeota archaeon]|nr:hypothetical protein [Candidatus Woesearchaeota archaeon]